MGDPMRLFMRAAKGYQCQGWIVHPGPDLPGFSGAGEGVHACSASFLPHGDLAIPKVAL